MTVKFSEAIGRVRIAPSPTYPNPPSTKTIPVSLAMFRRKHDLIKSINDLRVLVMTIEKRMDDEMEEVKRINKVLMKVEEE